MTFTFFVTLFFSSFFLLVDILQEAGYFYSISQGSELTVTFVQIGEKEESDDKTKAMSTAMEKIGMLIPDVILLYASNREILELFLKKVRFCTFICHFFIFLFLRFLTCKAVSLPAMNTSDAVRLLTLDFNWLFLPLQKSCVNVNGYTWILQGQVC